MVLAPNAVVLAPSLAETLKVADPLKFAVGVKVIPLRAALASAIVAEKLMLAVPLPVGDVRLAMLPEGSVIVPWVAVTVTVRVPPSASPTVTPEMLSGTSSAVVRDPTESVTVGVFWLADTDTVATAAVEVLLESSVAVMEKVRLPTVGVPAVFWYDRSRAIAWASASVRFE